jgi:CBS domain containing-hemolysin-like protein
MLVNVLYFAIASVLTFRIEQYAGVMWAAITAFVLFCILVLFGEILPKSFAYSSSKAISISAAAPAYITLKILLPVISAFKFVFVEPALRLLLGPVQKPKAITADEFRSLIEQIKKRGLITADQNRLINEIIELASLKVQDCLNPRVDMAVGKVTDSAQRLQRIMRERNLTKIPVYDKRIDNIVGEIHLRNLLLESDKTVDKLVQPVHFVPEQKTIESLLEYFRKTHTDTAIVVDEYGGIAGSICLEDIAEELLGPMEVAEEAEPVKKTGPFEYRLSGSLPIHDWADAFNIELEESRITTIGGLVTALLGKIPEQGDYVYLGNLKFTIERMQKHRIKTLILSLEPIQDDN